MPARNPFSGSPHQQRRGGLDARRGASPAPDFRVGEAGRIAADAAGRGVARGGPQGPDRCERAVVRVGLDDRQAVRAARRPGGRQRLTGRGRRAGQGGPPASVGPAGPAPGRAVLPGSPAWGEPVGFPPLHRSRKKASGGAVPGAGLVASCQGEDGGRRWSAPPGKVRQRPCAWARAAGPAHRCEKRGSARWLASMLREGSTASQTLGKRWPRQGAGLLIVHCG